MDNTEKKWFVLYTKPRWEKKIAAKLESQGVEHYCPLNKVQRQWSDRKKVIYEPLFKGYIFVSNTIANKWDLKNVDGILNFVYWLGKPVLVKEEEINTIKKFLGEFTDVSVIDNSLKKDTMVTINQGVFMNYKGMVVEIVGKHVKVKIDSLQYELIATFEKNNLTKI